MRNNCSFVSSKSFGDISVVTSLEEALNWELKDLSCHNESRMCSFYNLGHTHSPFLEKIISSNQTYHVLTNIFLVSTAVQ